jgi:NTP pyrophosphatase (non-canonical NTP hydrolase)
MSWVPPFAIGSRVWPGLAKLAEEVGELQQVLGKVLAYPYLRTAEHPDGTKLDDRLVEELGDALAAIEFFVQNNPSIDEEAVTRRMRKKLARFHRWHEEHGNTPMVANVDIADVAWKPVANSPGAEDIDWVIMPPGDFVVKIPADGGPIELLTSD